MIFIFSGFLMKPEKHNLPDGEGKFSGIAVNKFRRRMEFHHFLLESDEQKDPNNPENPV
jgi:hypothetical protein